MKKHALVSCLILLGLVVAGTCVVAQEPAGEVSNNFTRLMQSSWEDVAKVAAMVVLRIVLTAVAGFFLGVVVGVVLYLVCLKLGLLRAGWNWYRWVGWLWALVFIGVLGLAGAYAGAWLGGGKALDHAINREHIPRRVVANLYMAAALDRAEYDVTGQESTARLIELIEGNENLAGLSLKALATRCREAIARDMDMDEGGSQLKVTLLEHLSDQRLEELAGKELYEADPRVAVVVIYTKAVDPEAYRTYIDENPGRASVGQAAERMFTRLEQGMTSKLVKLIWWDAIGAVAVALGILVVCVGLFQLVVHLAGGRATPPPTAPTPGPPPR